MILKCRPDARHCTTVYDDDPLFFFILFWKNLTPWQVEFMSGMGNTLANSFLEYHVPSKWLKPSHLEPRDYREAYIKVLYSQK